MEKPFLSETNPFVFPTNPFLPRQRKPSYQPLTPQEEQSLTSQLLGTTTSLLGTLGYVLDTPGAYTRGVLAGRPGERVSGRELLTDWGITDQNDPNAWEVADFLGAGAEVVADPFFFLTPLKLTKAGRVLEAAGGLDDVFDAGKAVNQGIRQTTMNQTLGDVAKAFPGMQQRLETAATGAGTTLDELSSMPLRSGMNFSIPGTGIEANLFNGPIAQGAARAMDAVGSFAKYNPLSSLVRSQFSKLAGNTAYVPAQKAFEKHSRDADKIAAETFLGGYDDLAKAGFEKFDSDSARQVAEMFSAEDLAMAPIEDVNRRLQLLGMKPLTPEAFEVVKARGSATEKTFQEAFEEGMVPAYFDVQAGTVKPAGWQSEYGTKHNPRYGGFPVNDEGLVKKGFESKAIEQNAGSLNNRNKAYDIPGGTAQVNKFSVDPELVGTTVEKTLPNGKTIKAKEFALDLEDRTIKILYETPDLIPPEFRQPEVLQFALEKAKAKQYKPLETPSNALEEIAQRHGIHPMALQKVATEKATENAALYDDIRDSYLNVLAGQPMPDGTTQRLIGSFTWGKIYNADRASDVPGFDDIFVGIQNGAPELIDAALKNSLSTDPHEALLEMLQTLRSPSSIESPLKMRSPRSATYLEQIAGQTDRSVFDGIKRGWEEKFTAGEEAALKGYNKAKDLATALEKLDPRHAELKVPLFGNHYLDDSARYLREMQTMTAGGKAIKQMLLDVASPQQSADMVPLTDAVQQIFGKNPVKALESTAQHASGRGINDINGVYVPQQAVDQAKRLMTRFEPGSGLEITLGVWDKITAFYKNMLTLAPSFATRNFGSGQMANVVDGHMSVTELPKYVRQATQFVNGKEVDLSKVPMFAGMSKEDANRKLKELLGAYNLWQNPLDEAAVTAAKEADPRLGSFGGATALERYQNKLPGNVPLSLMGSLGTGIKDTVMGAATTAYDVASGRFKIDPRVNPLGVKNVLGETDTAALPKLHSQVNTFVEGQNRIAPFISLLEKGVDPGEAAKRVMATHIDYGNLADSEKIVMRRIFPFYTFTRRMLQHTFEELANKPGGIMAQTIKAADRSSKDESYVPPYVSEGLSIPLRPDRFLTTSGMLMHEGPLTSLVGIGPSFNSTMMRTAQKVAGSSHPLIKGGIETISGTNLFTGKPYKEVWQFPFAKDAMWGAGENVNFTLGMSPFSRQTNMFRKVVDDRKGLLDKALSLGLGVGITDLSGGVERAKQLESNKILKKLLDESPHIKTMTNFYVPKEDRGKLSDEELQLMRLYTLRQRQNREAADQRRTLLEMQQGN